MIVFVAKLFMWAVAIAITLISLIVVTMMLVFAGSEHER